MGQKIINANLDDQLSAQCSSTMRLRLQRLAALSGQTSESAMIRAGLEYFLRAEEERLGLPPIEKKSLAEHLSLQEKPK